MRHTWKKLLSLACAAALIFTLAPLLPAEAGTTGNEQYDKQESLQPLGTQFQYDDILNWTPESDVDARYNRATVPLAERKTGYVLNPFANPDARMVLSGDAYPIGGVATHSYGTEGAWRRYALNFWQYVDVYNFWGGPINTPTPELVDMAHRNGVPVIGTVFFENTGTAGPLQRRMYSPVTEGGRTIYPYADKLWEIAEFYGFDGWFFNFEASGSYGTASDMLNFLRYMQVNKPRPEMILCSYDAPMNGGFASTLNATVKTFLTDSSGNRRSDYHFGDYKWTNASTGVNNNTTALATASSRISPYRYASTWPIHMQGYKTIGAGGSSDQVNGLMGQLPWLMHTTTSASTFNSAKSTIPTAIPAVPSAPLSDVRGGGASSNAANLQAGGWLTNSIGFFGGHAPINLSNNVSDFLNVQDARLWSGYRGLNSTAANMDTGASMPHDPTIGYRGYETQARNGAATTAEAWVGVSQLLSDKTVILDFPFSTRFNPGIGDKFFVDGAVAKDNAWTNRGIQDILPTWRWSVKRVGQTLPASVTATNATTAAAAAGNPTTWDVLPSFDTGDAWYGGASLKFKNRTAVSNVATANEIKLYSTFLDFDANTDYELTYVAKGSALQIGFYTAANYSAYQTVTATAGATVNGWTTYTANLSALKGRTIYGLCVITGTGTVNANLGEIIIDVANKPAALPAPQNLTLDAYQATSPESGEARIYWDPVNDDAERYEIYQVFADGSRHFLNATYANAFYLSNVKRDPGSDKVKLEVTAVDDNLVRGAAATISFDFGMGAGDANVVPMPDNPNIALDPDFTKHSYIVSKENTSEPGKALFDGDRVQSKWCVVGTSNATATAWTNYNGHYVIIDFKQPVTIGRWIVANAGPQEDVAMNTRTYSLAYTNSLYFTWPSNYLVNSGSSITTANANLFNTYRGTADGTTGNAAWFGRTGQTWVRADRVQNNPTTSAGDLTDRDFTPVTARYWMFLVEQAMNATSNGALRVFELELYQYPKSSEPSGSVNANQVRITRGTTNDTVSFKNLPVRGTAATTVYVYDSLNATTPIASATRNSSGNATVTLTGANRLNAAGGRIYYDLLIAGYAKGDRLSVPYGAVDSAVSAAPRLLMNTDRFGIDSVQNIRRFTSALWSGGYTPTTKWNSYFGALDGNLPEGSYVYQYDNQNDVFPARISNPVADGSTLARIDSLEFSKDGGFTWVSAKEPGKNESSKFKLYYNGNGIIDWTAYDALEELAGDAAVIAASDLSGYTASSVAALNNALAAADAELLFTNQTSSNIDKYNALDDAINGLTVDKAALAAAIASFEAKIETQWTTDSWADAKAMYLAACDVFADADATVAEVAEATGNLEDALAALVELVFNIGSQPTSVVLRKGMTYQINIDSNNPASVVYLASNANITVSSTGLVTAVKTSSAVVTVIDVYAQTYLTITFNVTS